MPPPPPLRPLLRPLPLRSRLGSSRPSSPPSLSFSSLPLLFLHPAPLWGTPRQVWGSNPALPHGSASHPHPPKPVCTPPKPSAGGGPLDPHMRKWGSWMSPLGPRMPGLPCLCPSLSLSRGCPKPDLCLPHQITVTLLGRGSGNAHGPEFALPVLVFDTRCPCSIPRDLWPVPPPQVPEQSSPLSPQPR